MTYSEQVAKHGGDLVAQWYENNLNESERRAIVKNIAGAMEYGLTRNWNCLAEHVSGHIRWEYRRITSKSDVGHS